MRPDPIDIVLGEKSFKIRPLTIAQHQEIGRGLADSNPASPVDSSIAILKAALRRDYPDDAAAIGEIECSLPEITEASGAIIAFAGLMRRAEAGEV